MRLRIRGLLVLTRLGPVWWLQLNSEHVEYRVIVIVIPDIVLVVMKIAKVRYTPFLGGLIITLSHPHTNCLYKLSEQQYYKVQIGYSDTAYEAASFSRTLTFCKYFFLIIVSSQ